MSVENLPTGDKRYEDLFEAIEEVVFRVGKGLPLPGVIGVIELFKHKLIEDQSK